MLKHAIAVGSVAMSLLVAMEASAQFKAGHAPGDLSKYDWTAWLVGEWEGTWESDTESVPYRQSFELSPDRQYIITHNQRGSGPDAYRGVGVFSYYPRTGEAYGAWFGSMHDSNDGYGQREGDALVWTIHRMGRRIIRVRTRTGPDTYVVENTTLEPDGTERFSREVMRRVGTGTR